MRLIVLPYMIILGVVELVGVNCVQHIWWTTATVGWETFDRAGCANCVSVCVCCEIVLEK